MKLYTLKSQIYLDKINQEYKKIIVINKLPLGILKNNVIRLRNEKLSIFDINNEPCLYALKDPNTNELLELDNITEIFTYLIENGYEIDTSISKLLLKNNNTNKDFICVIKEY